jgi:hypothetical protein
MSWVSAISEAAAVPGDDEERVVDADADADHRRSAGRPVRDIDDAAQQLSEGHRHAEAEHGGEQRQPHRHRRAEGEQQDQGGRDEADPLPTNGGCLGQRRDRAAGLDLQGVVAGGEEGFDEGLGLCRGVLVRGLVERDETVRGPPVLGDLAGATFAERAGDTRHVGGGGDAEENVLRTRADRGRGETVLGVEDDLDGVAGLLGEIGLQCLGRGL